MKNIKLSDDEAARLIEFLELTAARPGRWPNDTMWWASLVEKIKGQTK